MSNTDPTKEPGVNSDDLEEKVVPASYKTLAVLLIYKQSSPVKVLAVIEERKHLRKKMLTFFAKQHKGVRSNTGWL